MPSSEGLAKALKPELDKVFKPAFLGRLVIIPYFPIRDEALKQIIRLKLGKISRRLQETHRITLAYGEELVEEVARRCTEVESGARNVDNILTNTLLPEISKQILAGMAEGAQDRNRFTSGSAKTAPLSTPRPVDRTASCQPLRSTAHFASRRRSATMLCCSRASRDRSVCPLPSASC